MASSPRYPENVTFDAWSSELIDWVRAQARAQGFDLAGVAPALDAAHPEASESAQRFEDWIDAGHAGEMQYLARRNESGELLRKSARVAMPWARSVLVCALNYNLAGDSPAPRSVDPTPANAGWIARYTWTGTPDAKPLDYHDDLLRRLRLLETALQERAPCQTRCYVDTGPLLERDFAARAGVGWIGKNTCVLNQQLGSWLLLGVIVTSLPVQATLALAPDRCGSCTRCIDACPTDALLTPVDGSRQMDASRCIAYLTIENKGEIPIELRQQMGRQVFGCDICQEVCPWNRHAPESQPEGLARRDELINPSLEWLASLDPAGYKRAFSGSPLERTKRPRLLRNVAIAMGNSGQQHFIPQLERWIQSEPSPVREAASWALTNLRSATEDSPRSASIETTPDPHA
jgi:epoxyqueuosine reductase